MCTLFQRLPLLATVAQTLTASIHVECTFKPQPLLTFVLLTGSPLLATLYSVRRSTPFDPISTGHANHSSYLCTTGAYGNRPYAKRSLFVMALLTAANFSAPWDLGDNIPLTVPRCGQPGTPPLTIGYINEPACFGKWPILPVVVKEGGVNALRFMERWSAKSPHMQL